MTKRVKPRPSAEVPDPDDPSDAESFARAMVDVVRLPEDPKEPRESIRARARSTAAPRTKLPLDESVDEACEDFVAPGVDRREIRKLKRGEHVVGARRDLHGMTAAEARASVKQFLVASSHRHRCVCIVHGRGLHSEGNVSVLRASVRQSIRAHPSVLAYADAPRSDGGAGAVYVLLRK